MAGEKERVDAYLATVALLEPDIAPVDYSAALTSIAISLKRIADVLNSDTRIDQFSATIERAIWNGLKDKDK